MSINTHDTLPSDLSGDTPGPSSPLLPFRFDERPANGHPAMAQVHTANMLGIDYGPEVRTENIQASLGSLVSRALLETAQSPEGVSAHESVPHDYALVTAGILRANPQLRERGRPIPERIRDASAAIQMSLRPERQPISRLAERTVMCALDFLDDQLPGSTVETLDAHTSTLISAYGYITETATRTEHYALASYATSRLNVLVSGLRSPAFDEIPDRTYMEAVATMHSALAMRAYGARRTYDEQPADLESIDKQLLLLQAEQDANALTTYFGNRREDAPGRPYGFGDLSPQPNSGYTDWDVRAMRYFLGYHQLNGTIDQLGSEKGVRKFLQAVTSEDVVTKSLSTVTQPLLELHELVPEQA